MYAPVLVYLCVSHQRDFHNRIFIIHVVTQRSAIRCGSGKETPIRVPALVYRVVAL